MSGQRNKKPSDVIKIRQEYLDNLSLQVQLNEANEQAVKQFVSTGQVPPISQMKDTRSTSEILLDVEKLKINLIKDLEPIANPQFAQQIIGRLVQSPLNIDNRLIIFTAQRIDDIVKNLHKTYKYGIKGDANDAEMFVSFINKMYTDKNKLTTNTKAFMNRMGSSDTTTGSSAVSGQHNTIVALNADFNSLTTLITKNILPMAIGNAKVGEIRAMIIIIRTKFQALLQIMPLNASMFNIIEKLLVGEEGTTGYARLNNDYDRWLYFVNHNIPNLEYARTLIDDLYKDVSNQTNDINKILVILQKLDDVLDVDLVELQALVPISERLRNLSQSQPYRPDVMQLGIATPATVAELATLKLRTANNLGLLAPPNPALVARYAPLQFSPNVRNIPKIEGIRREAFDLLANQVPPIQGQGLHRMKGRGLTSVDYSQGIEPSARYIKFGRYMINNKKLNDNVLSLRRSKGSMVSTIPATKMTSELGNVFKKIVGGGIPSYDELNKLTDAEKKYLYKVSQEADIYDKIKIPTPCKDEEEKDIHLFNVMKGEIMAGNNSKELVGKFKVLLNKLSRTSVLPKSQVREILEELLELGF